MNEPSPQSQPPERPHQRPPEPKHKEHGGKLKDTLSTLGIIVLAPIVALFLTAFIFQSYQVDGPSMETTLQNRDRLIVTKTGKTWSRITGSDYVPKRYEVIVFNHTGQYEDQFVAEKQLIKRVIGLPGDRLVVKDGIVTIFNAQNPNGFLVDRDGPEKNTISNTTGNIDETIKAGELYVMGDNRGNSLDSRSFGPIRSTDAVGKLTYRIYPFGKVEHY